MHTYTEEIHIVFIVFTNSESISAIIKWRPTAGSISGFFPSASAAGGSTVATDLAPPTGPGKVAVEVKEDA